MKKILRNNKDQMRRGKKAFNKIDIDIYGKRGLYINYFIDDTAFSLH